jgi:hypothetical protein
MQGEREIKEELLKLKLGFFMFEIEDSRYGF